MGCLGRDIQNQTNSKSSNNHIKTVLTKFWGNFWKKLGQFLIPSSGHTVHWLPNSHLPIWRLPVLIVHGLESILKWGLALPETSRPERTNLAAIVTLVCWPTFKVIMTVKLCTYFITYWMTRVVPFRVCRRVWQLMGDERTNLVAIVTRVCCQIWSHWLPLLVPRWLWLRWGTRFPIWPRSGSAGWRRPWPSTRGRGTTCRQASPPSIPLVRKNWASLCWWAQCDQIGQLLKGLFVTNTNIVS